MPRPRESSAGYRTLAALGSATVHEAAGRLAPLDPAIRALDGDFAIAGPAFTVRCAPRDNLAVHRAVAAAPEGSVLVVDAGADDSGYWGEILTAAALTRSLAGLVIDGGVRDTAAIRRMRFPVWARTVAIAGVDKLVPGDVQVPIRCGGVDVNPGDVLVADSDGVMIVRRETFRAVLSAAEERSNREAALLRRISAGELTLDLLGLRAHLPDREP